LLLLVLLLLLGPWTTATLLLLLAVVASLRRLALASLLLLWPRSSISVLVVLGGSKRLFLWRWSGVFDRAGHLLAVVGRRALLVPRRGVLDLLRRDEVVGRHGAVLVLVAGSSRRR
jgi:hypothetical protein